MNECVECLESGIKHYKLELIGKTYHVLILSCDESIVLENAIFNISVPLVGASTRHIALAALLTLLFGETNRRLKRIKNPLYRFLAVLFGIHQINKLAEVAERGYKTIQIAVFRDKLPTDIECKVRQTQCLQAINYIDVMREFGVKLSDTVTSSCQLLERYALTRSATFAGIGRL